MIDLSTQLHDYFDEIVEHVEHDDLFVGPISVGLELESAARRHRLGWAVALAVTVAVLILGGVLAAVVSWGTDESPVITQPNPVPTTLPESSPTTLPEATTPTTVPEATPHTTIPQNDPPTAGTLSTPLGPARWVRIPADGSLRPAYGGQAVEWPSGFAIFQPPNFLGPMRLLVSEDGTEWHEEPIPAFPATVENASLSLVNDVYWLVATPPGRMWRSTDGTSWDEIDPNQLLPPNPHDLSWLQQRYSPPISLGDLTISVGTFEGMADWANLTPAERTLVADELIAQYLIIIQDGAISYVEAPWGRDGVTLFGAEEFVYAYLDGPPTSVWRSSDGRSWTNTDRPSFLRGEAKSVNANFTSLPGSLTATNSDLPIPAWETTDGISWTPLPDGLPTNTNPVRLASGWFANDGSMGGPEDGDAWWMHVGGEWVSLAELGMESAQSGCVVGTTAIESTTFFFGGGCFPPVSPDLWILSFDP